MEAFLNYLGQEIGSATLVFLIFIAMFIGGAVWVTYILTKFTTRWKGKEDILKELYDKWHEDIPTIKERTNLVFQRVYSDKSTIETSSPARLTKVGEEVQANIGADAILDQLRPELAKLVSQRDPRNAYDLQQACFAVVEEHLPRLLSNSTLDIAKTQAIEYGIPLDNVLAVVAILLRNSLVHQYGWSYADIDKHDTLTSDS